MLAFKNICTYKKKAICHPPKKKGKLKKKENRQVWELKVLKIRAEAYWGRSLKSYCPELSSPFLCWELLHLASTQQKRMHVSANSIQNPVSYFKKPIKMVFHCYARFCSKEAQSVTWISFYWHGGVVKEEWRLWAVLKRQRTLVGKVTS